MSTCNGNYAGKAGRSRAGCPCHIRVIINMAAGLAFALMFSPATVVAQEATTTTRAADGQDTSTDFLSDAGWRALSREQRRERARSAMIAQYVPDGGAPKVDDLDGYVEKFGALTVYDPRYYLYDVKATHVAGTTGSVVLSGEAYPHLYSQGIQETLESLGFNVTKNQVVELPRLAAGEAPYGVSTTSAATLRKEPRPKAEQLNSVAHGGWIRVLRTANDEDVSSVDSSSRHAPGADQLEEDSPEAWVLAQTMEGYLGFARKADFEMRGDYQLPDGILKLPIEESDAGTTLPAGVFVYNRGDSGWELFSGEKLPAEAQVADLRPDFTAEGIEKLMQPFMDTNYVWGGVTDQGIDCSGFSQFFMRTAGVMIPRDAVQQATGGFIVAWGEEDVTEMARPGDLLFFAAETGRISHVAISLGGGRIIHSAGKGVHLQRLDEPRDEDSDETYGGRVLFARRVAAR